MTRVLVRVTVAAMKHDDRKKVGKKIIYLT